ncbi:hypothetical protein [Minwuia thermotolerans]|uniref:Uncharacterized protein n=1 Tax=Minwuia thermotolerans TaxID=2056226 RepID=A0A2M9G2M2_9PROT|nr:hypothetical protein [Minwuia thermotolerans]PJK29972.1 hypothetical protein CVT23_09400 [Minwuia thermotolerans]
MGHPFGIRSPFGMRSPFGARDDGLAFLFAGGEEGAWYDPSDLSTLFQDSVGTTPVTADGDPVGLMLDKSKALALGAELVTNGDFDTDTTGWAGSSGGSISAVAGNLVLEVPAGDNFAEARYVATVESGKFYKITVDLIEVNVSGTSGARISAADSTNLGDTWGVTASNLSPGTHQLIVQADNTGLALRLFADNGSGVSDETVLWDNVSIREIAGNHATQSTSAARPVYKTSGGLHWLQFDGVDDFLNIGSALDLSPAAGSQVWTQAFGADSNSDTTYVYVSQRGANTPFITAANDGSTNTTIVSNDLTLNNTYVDGNLETPANQGDLHTLLEGRHLGRMEASVPSTSTFDAPQIGQYTTASFDFSGFIYSYVLVNKALTASEMSRLDAYQARKSGVTL